MFDVILVFLVVYLIFIIGGQSILQNRVEHYDIINEDYQELLGAYNEDMQMIRTEYEAGIEVAGGDAELETLARETYNRKLAVLDEQNLIDIEPYNTPLTKYYLEIIYFFSFGLLVIMTLLTVFLTGRTPGRRMMKVSLMSERSEGEFVEPNPIKVFFHDIILKYFFIVIVFTLSLYYGVLFIMAGLLLDIILIAVTRKKVTIRDYFLRMRIVGSDHR
jgi:hypothetical protein